MPHHKAHYKYQEEEDNDDGDKKKTPHIHKTHIKKMA